MNRWKVNVTKKAYKQMARLPGFIQDLADLAMYALEREGPMPKHWDVKKLGRNDYRLRLNYRYRMRYQVYATDVVVVVYYIGHRKDAY